MPGMLMFLLIVGVLGGSIYLSFRLDEKLHQKHPRALYFKWGYWNAIGMLFLGLVQDYSA